MDEQVDNSLRNSNLKNLKFKKSKSKFDHISNKTLNTKRRSLVNFFWEIHVDTQTTTDMGREFSDFAQQVSMTKEGCFQDTGQGLKQG
jgi:hypothetical protein